MRLRLIRLWILMLCGVSTCLALGTEYDALIDHSLGTDALEYEHNPKFNLQIDSVLVDAEVKTLPVDSTNHDRTATTYSRITGIVPIGPRFGTRYSLWTKGSYRKQEGDSEPRKIVIEQWAEGYARLELIIFTQSKLEIFFGVTYFGIPAYSRTTESPSVETTWEFSDVAFPVPHIGLVKRTGFVSGGFFYKQGAQRDREVIKRTTQDDSNLLFTETIHDPTTVGMFVKVPFGKGYFAGEFATIQGSEGGNKTDDGSTLTEDYTRARGIYLQPLGLAALKASLIHRTYSYSENRSVTLDSIPMTALHLKGLIGGEKNNGFLGLIYGYARDGQSITEFNAEYKIQAYGLSAGFNLSL